MSDATETTIPEVTIAGVTYKLGWSINSIAECERECGFTFEELVKRAENGSVFAARALFAGALKKYQPEITVRDAGDLMSKAGGMDRLAVLLTAATAQQPQPEAPAATRKRAPRVNGTRVQ